MIEIHPNAPALHRAAADQFVSVAASAIKARGRFAVALAGGSTPRPIYELLAQPSYASRLDWSRVHLFWGDERCVPPDDPRSNYAMVRRALLDRIAIPSDNIHRMRGEDEPHHAALAYERDLRAFFRTAQLPCLDLVWLGLGENGHTASLFPGTAALREQMRLVVAQYVEVVSMWRLSLTVPVINAAANVTFLVDGAAKAEILARVLTGRYEPEVLPAQLVQPTSGKLSWMVDAAASAQLPPTLKQEATRNE